MFLDVTTNISELAPAHDTRHTLDGSSLSRESLAYMIEIPAERIGGFLYTWVNGANLAGAAVCLFGAGIGDEPIFEHSDGIPVSPDADFHDWRVENMRVQIKELLKSVEVSYKSKNVSVQYEFDAVHPAYAYGTHKNGCPQWIANNRFEQHGLVKGELVVNNRTITFEGAAQRDHSWGTREWGVNQHWKWFHGQIGKDVCVHFWDLMALGKRHLCGYVYKNGLMAQITDVNTDFDHDVSLQTKSMTAVIIDDVGRQTKVNAMAYANFPFAVDPMVTLFESPLTLEIDGVGGGIGWMEVLWPNDLIEYMNNKQK